MTDEIKVGDLVTITDVAPECNNKQDIGKIVTICDIENIRGKPMYFTNLRDLYWHKDGIKKFAKGIMPKGAFKVGDVVVRKETHQFCVIQKIIIRHEVINHNITLDDIIYKLKENPWGFKHDELVKAEEVKISIDNALNLI